MESTKTGYKKPPIHRRFPPGQSGNPAGRPKGSRNLRTEVDVLLNKKIKVSENGNERTISRQEALLLTLFNKALGGDVKAATTLFAMVQKLSTSEATSPRTSRSLNADDKAIINEYMCEQGWTKNG